MFEVLLEQFPNWSRYVIFSLCSTFQGISTLKQNGGDLKLQSRRTTDKYWVPVVAKTIDVLDRFRSDLEELTLEQVVHRTNVPHTTAYRILHGLGQ